jgi:hypothetical protein
MVQAFSTQDSVAGEVWEKEDRRAGKAAAAMVASTETRNTAALAMAKTTQGPVVIA